MSEESASVAVSGIISKIALILAIFLFASKKGINRNYYEFELGIHFSIVVIYVITLFFGFKIVETMDQKIINLAEVPHK